MIFGADFSTLPEEERCGAVYYEHGHRVDLVECLARHGITSARIRLWVDPYDEKGAPYGGGTSDLPAALALAKRAKAAGMGIMLDLHYSDFWADPGRQCVPKQWQGLSVNELAERVRTYTAETLETFEKEGLALESVQAGNEITNGMLWPLGRIERKDTEKEFDRLAQLLNAGLGAIREGSDARSLVHLERSGNRPLWTEWLDSITARGVVFDELAASYYPYWHGTLEEMAENLAFCAARYDKDIRIVESSYAFTGRHYNPAGEGAALVMTDAANCCADGRPMPFPATKEGQAAYTKALIGTAARIPRLKALYWWEPGWIPAPGAGWATEASLRYCGEEGKPLGNEWANQCLFDYAGHALPALDVFGKDV